MNNKNAKLQIYQGIIEYLLKSTNYTLKNIADHTGASIQHLRSIYIGDQVPLVFSSELQLIKLYQIILECHKHKSTISNTCNQKLPYLTME